MNKTTILDFLRSHKDEMHEKFGLQKKIDIGIESSIKPIVHKDIEKEIEYV